MKRVRKFWREFREAEPGNRFRDRYRRRAEQRARGERILGQPVILGLAVLCCLIAMPLMITPGPAVLFWGLAGFLVAGESARAARSLDWLELKCRELWRDWRKRRSRGKPPELRH